jgi:hypothetical protein
MMPSLKLVSHDAEQLDAAADQAVPQIAEQNDGGSLPET